MAKNSAASKGYRKTEKKKPFLTKKEIIALVIIVAVIVIGAIIINAIPNIGTIPAGKVKTGDIISVAGNGLKGRYVKLGEINELEGFTMESSTSSETPTGGYDFTPAEDNGLANLRIGGAIWDAKTMIETMLPSIQTMGAEEYSEEAIQATIGGRNAYVITARYTSYDEEKAGEDASEPAEGEINSYNQYIYSYIDAGEHSISLSATIEGDDASVYIPDEELVEYMNQFAGAFTLIEK